MVSLWGGFREYGFSAYAAKEALAHSAVGRRLFERTVLARARRAWREGRWYDYAAQIAGGARRLEGRKLSADLQHEYAMTLAMATADESNSEPCSRIVQAYLVSPEGRRERHRYMQYGFPYSVAMKIPKENDVVTRQGNLVVLKASDPRGAEKGVLYLQYTESIRPFVAMFDVQRLATHYRLVVEPSWWGYQDVNFLLLAGIGMDVTVQAQDEVDFQVVQRLGGKLTALRLGAGDWIDGDVFTPSIDVPKEFDFVMVANWSPVKRHTVFFDALRKASLQDSPVALVGYPWEGRTRKTIERLAQQYGLSNVSIFESVPRTTVARIVASSRVGVMLTRREGANRGIYECFFCDVPVVLYRENRGVNKAHINEQTGYLASDSELPDVLRMALDGEQKREPRSWALRNTGYANAWHALNECLRESALSRGEPYERPIARIFSTPGAAYVSEDDRVRLLPEYERLVSCLRPA